jgi:hypothetical protein
MRPIRLLSVTALAAVLAANVHAADSAATRAPSAQESASFQAFYRERFPGKPAPQPGFRIERPNARAPWSVGATVDMAPVRGLRTLCRIDRLEFRLAGTWSAAPPRQLAWRQAGACAAGTPAIELRQRMPDTDVVWLLERQASLLANARLVMAGNSACAVARSFPFTLQALDVGRPGPGGEEMAALVYRSERDTIVNVWMRRSGAAHDLWTVSCPAAPKL